MINELLKDFEKRNRKNFKKELTITCHSDMIQKLLRQPKTNRINASDEVDL